MSESSSESSPPNRPRPPLIDTHLHLDDGDDPHAVVEAAAHAGVGVCVVIAGNLADATRAAGVAARQSDVFFTTGLHPHEASSFDGDLEAFAAFCGDRACVAVGEIGLDYHYDRSPRDVQRRVFAQFLQLAVREQMPAVVHCRDAYRDCLDILRSTLPAGHPFEIHSFTGTVTDLRAFLELGAYVSFNGIVTFKKADNVRRALRVVPLDRLLVETDSPYLAPAPYRGKRNQPAYLPATVERIATELDVGFDELAATTTANARRFFGLPDAAT